MQELWYIPSGCLFIVKVKTDMDLQGFVWIDEPVGHSICHSDEVCDYFAGFEQAVQELKWLEEEATGNEIKFLNEWREKQISFILSTWADNGHDISGKTLTYANKERLKDWFSLSDVKNL